MVLRVLVSLLFHCLGVGFLRLSGVCFAVWGFMC